MISPRLSLGPLFFNWAPERRRDFYFRIADEAAVDSVCLGEVVCSKREPYFADYLPAVAERLRRAGKEVVMSSLALVTTRRERDAVAALAEWDGAVEANDMAAVSLFRGRDFHLGPFLNVYNEDTLAALVGLGASRVCLPVEISGAAYPILARVPGVEIEALAFGRMPLAVSARCYHARAHGLHKDGCQYVCDRDDDGMVVQTLDGESFLAINGTQTLSYRYLNLIGDLATLRRAGVGRFRLQPHDTDMVAVAQVFRDALDDRLDAAAANARLAGHLPGVGFANGYVHDVEGVALVAAR